MRRMLLAVLLLAVPMALQAQFEAGRYQTSSGVYPQLTYFRTDSVAPKANVYLWSLTQNGWAEGIIGLDTKSGNLEVSAGVGVETSSASWGRMQLIALYGSPTDYISGVYENGGSGYWYVAEMSTRGAVRTLTGSQKVGIGVRMQRFVGVGPRVELELNKHFLIWAVPIAWDTENQNSRSTVVTLRYSP